MESGSLKSPSQRQLFYRGFHDKEASSGPLPFSLAHPTLIQQCASTPRGTLLPSKLMIGAFLKRLCLQLSTIHQGGTVEIPVIAFRCFSFPIRQQVQDKSTRAKRVVSQVNARHAKGANRDRVCKTSPSRRRGYLLGATPPSRRTQRERESHTSCMIAHCA